MYSYVYVIVEWLDMCAYILSTSLYLFILFVIFILFKLCILLCTAPLRHVCGHHLYLKRQYSLVGCLYGMQRAYLVYILILIDTYVYMVMHTVVIANTPIIYVIHIFINMGMYSTSDYILYKYISMLILHNTVDFALITPNECPVSCALRC
jgi:hypothetical protein